MDGTKFTPGPWTVRQSIGPHDDAFDYAISSGDTPVLAEVFGRSSDGGWPPAEANAHLIAAAPELYEALEAMVNATEIWNTSVRKMIGRNVANGIDFEAGKAALALARGEPRPTKTEGEG